MTVQKPILWALSDCNSFYCSCERLFKPHLDQKPVVVLSNNDGCLIALTPEAKALGFKMGDVYHLVKKDLEAQGVTAFSSNYTLYADISRRFIDTLESVVPIVEQYSIDEAFIPFDQALTANALQVGWTMHDRVKKWVGIPIRVGIGPTRTLAKLANNWSKKISRVLLLEPGSKQLERILDETPTEGVWGIGRRQSVKLANMGIYTAKQLRDMDLSAARELLTVVGERTVLELRGVQCIEDSPVIRKSMISSRSFGQAVSRKDDLMEAMTMHCAIAGEKMRKEGLVASVLAVHMETSRHGSSPYFHAGATAHLTTPTNSTIELIEAARSALDSCYSENRKFMKGGVALFEIVEESRRQISLLETLDSPKKLKLQALDQCVDRINNKFGRGAVRYLGQGNPKAVWHMKQDRLTGRLTTQISDLPRVK